MSTYTLKRNDDTLMGMEFVGKFDKDGKLSTAKWRGRLRVRINENDSGCDRVYALAPGEKFLLSFPTGKLDDAGLRDRATLEAFGGRKDVELISPAAPKAKTETKAKKKDKE